MGLEVCVFRLTALPSSQECENAGNGGIGSVTAV